MKVLDRGGRQLQGDVRRRGQGARRRRRGGRHPRKAVERHEDDLQKALGLLRLRAPAGRRRARERDRPDQGDPARVRGERDLDLQRLPPLDQGRDQARDGPVARRSPSRASRTSTRAKATLARKRRRLLEEPDLDPAIMAKVDDLEDRLSKETFFREIAEIEQAATAIQAEYRRRYDEALDAQRRRLHAGARRAGADPGLGAPRRRPAGGGRRATAPVRAIRNWNNQTIPHLRSVTEACDARLATAVEKVHTILEGERVATVSVSQFFAGGIENEEQLDQALVRHPRRILAPLGAGKDRDREVAVDGEGDAQRDRTSDPERPAAPREGLRRAVAGRLRRHAGRHASASGRARI